RCPKDISIVGHNDMPLVDIMSPPLTTIRIPHREMGSEAARLLMLEIAGEAPLKRHIILRPSLIIRSSTSAPPQKPARKKNL
ncbi:substrate-binding domain-containing protein, partial [Pseudorhodoplanes sp.]|uniref:substrate-binding domain-containing protein n=1 Tax=Pseudorhodoplanes sp. TaxID=1934341 RepID=UPI003D0DB1DC